MNNPNQALALQTFHSHNLALEIVLARDVEERAQASNASWIANLGNLTGLPEETQGEKPQN